MGLPHIWRTPESAGVKPKRLALSAGPQQLTACPRSAARLLQWPAASEDHATHKRTEWVRSTCGHLGRRTAARHPVVTTFFCPEALGLLPSWLGSSQFGPSPPQCLNPGETFKTTTHKTGKRKRERSEVPPTSPRADPGKSGMGNYSKRWETKKGGGQGTPARETRRPQGRGHLPGRRKAASIVVIPASFKSENWRRRWRNQHWSLPPLSQSLAGEGVTAAALGRPRRIPSAADITTTTPPLNCQSSLMHHKEVKLHWHI